MSLSGLLSGVASTGVEDGVRCVWVSRVVRIGRGVVVVVSVGSGGAASCGRMKSHIVRWTLVGGGERGVEGLLFLGVGVAVVLSAGIARSGLIMAGGVASNWMFGIRVRTSLTWCIKLARFLVN